MSDEEALLAKGSKGVTPPTMKQHIPEFFFHVKLADNGMHKIAAYDAHDYVDAPLFVDAVGNGGEATRIDSAEV